MPSSFLPISALPEIAKRIDGAERILKADIARMKSSLPIEAQRSPRQLPKPPSGSKGIPRPARGLFTARHALAAGRNHGR
jgi:hypothetical protein